MNTQDIIDQIVSKSYGRKYRLKLFDDGSLFASYDNLDDNPDDVLIGKNISPEIYQIISDYFASH